MPTRLALRWLQAATRHALLAALLVWVPGMTRATPNPTGEYFGPPTLHVVREPQRKVDTADFNRDGVPDVMISGLTGLDVRLGVLNAGELTFPNFYRHPLSNANEAAIADFNSDGILDIAVAGELAGVDQLRGNGSGGVGDGTFTEVATFALGATWSVAAADVNGDGILDLVVAAYSGLRVLDGTGTAGQGDGGFLPARKVQTVGYPKGMVVADLDADGALDIVTATERGYITINRGKLVGSQPNGEFLAPQQLFTLAGLTYDVCVADFNSDGLLDIASGDYVGASVTVFTQNADHSFAAPVVHPLPGVTLGLKQGDFDGDGRTDLVAGAASSGSTFCLLLNQGPQGSSPDHLGFIGLVGPARVTYGLAVADLNGDGGQDVLAAGLGDNQLALFHHIAIPGNFPLFTSVEGAGRVIRDPYGVSYAAGTQVTLTAEPAVGYRFLQWSGDASGNLSTITISMDGPRSVIAHFEFITHTLELTVSGSGTVTRSPDAPSYPLNTVVRLTATPDVGHRFAGYSGDEASLNRVLDVVMDADKSISASFVVDERFLPVIEGAMDVPQDEGGQVELRWSACIYESDPPTPTERVHHYWLWREVPEAAYRARRATWVGAPTERGWALRRTMAADREYFWEFVAAVPASGAATYSRLISTTNDSTEFGNPRTSFLVQGRNLSDTFWLDSMPDSGYSVDNLAPPPPAQVFVSRQSGLNVVHWTASRAPDVTRYRMYRSGTAEFVPSAREFVAETSDTTVSDLAAGPAFYKVLAVDRAGNASAAALATQETSPTPRFGILAVTPNPATGGVASVRLARLEGGPAVLEVFDLSGRRHTAMRIPDEPGEYTVRLGVETRLPPGLYWVRLRQAGREHGARLVVIE